MSDKRSVKVGRRTVEVSNPDKVLFLDDGITKGDLVDYYRRVAEFMLPHLRDHPVAMERYPDGIAGQRIFQKDVPDYFPHWIDRVKVHKEGGTLQQVVCEDAATLAYLANQACITPPVFLSRTDRPDQLIFDLDPADDDFEEARVAALWLRSLLEELELPAFAKTTGGKGIHLTVPLDRRADFDTVRGFARDAAEELARRHPDRLTTEQRKDKRKGRLYLDVMRNAYAQTAVPPYAVRARPGATVAAPLDGARSRTARCALPGSPSAPSSTASSRQTIPGRTCAAAAPSPAPQAPERPHRRGLTAAAHSPAEVVSAAGLVLLPAADVLGDTSVAAACVGATRAWKIASAPQSVQIRGQLVHPLRQRHQRRQRLERQPRERHVQTRHHHDHAVAGQQVGHLQVGVEEVRLIDGDHVGLRPDRPPDVIGGARHQRGMVQPGVRGDAVGPRA
jgi:bifunctional non-homologous end joining protein LigD